MRNEQGGNKSVPIALFMLLNSLLELDLARPPAGKNSSSRGTVIFCDYEKLAQMLATARRLRGRI
jgi:hypothetical protein